jgi:hypothetical protein
MMLEAMAKLVPGFVDRIRQHVNTRDERRTGR